MEMKTTNLEKFMEVNYTDEQLAALLAHAENGLLSYNSCCCPVGAATAPHPLRSEHEYDRATPETNGCGHLFEARKLPHGVEAEMEYAHLGPDSARREAIIPLIRKEMDRRESAKMSPIQAPHRSLQKKAHDTMSNFEREYYRT